MIEEKENLDEIEEPSQEVVDMTTGGPEYHDYQVEEPKKKKDEQHSR